MVRAGQDSRNPFAGVIRASQPALDDEARLLGPICLLRNHDHVCSRLEGQKLAGDGPFLLTNGGFA